MRQNKTDRGIGGILLDPIVIDGDADRSVEEAVPHSTDNDEYDSHGHAEVSCAQRGGEGGHVVAGAGMEDGDVG